MISKNRIVGFIFVLASLVFILSKYLSYKSDIIEERVIVENKLINKENYYAIIEIAKINLKREFFAITDSRNNVQDNILVVKQSTFPNKGQKSNIILASHSGNGANAYFKNLYKLKINDRVKIYYDNKIFEYVIGEIEFQEKIGYLYLKNFDENMLTLITCTYLKNNTQTIYYANLDKVSKIS